MAKSNTLGVRLDLEDYAALKTLADRDDRSMARMAAKFIKAQIRQMLEKEGQITELSSSK